MPRKPKRVLIGLEIATAVRTRKCSADSSHRIGPGERLLEVKMPGPGNGKKGYCANCAARMLISAQDELGKIESDLQDAG